VCSPHKWGDRGEKSKGKELVQNPIKLGKKRRGSWGVGKGWVHPFYLPNGDLSALSEGDFRSDGTRHH